MSAQEWIDAAQKRADAATDGPWRADDEHGDMPGAAPAWCVSRTDDAGTYLGDVAYTSGPSEVTDARFIAAARTDLPKALDALRAVLDLASEWERRDPSGLAHVAIRRTVSDALGTAP